jgi:alcohol dehydrogenase class IV
MALPNANWNYPTAIRFGSGRIADLPAACRELGIERPLLVTDPGLAEMEMVKSAIASLGSCGLFSAIHSNPVGADVEAGVAAYRLGGHDGVIAFGGGSALDVGKVVAFMSGQTRPLWVFEDIGDWWTRADPAGIAPIIAVPTTAGTGSEVGRAGVILDQTSETKKIIFHPGMMPALVAASMGATAFQKGLGGMHALSHPIGALHGSHHGLTNAVLMPYVLAFNRPAIEERIAQLSGYIGLPSASFEAFLRWTLELRETFAIPNTLRELGVPNERADQIARMAEVDPSAGGNPVRFDAAAARIVFDAAMEGRL